MLQKANKPTTPTPIPNISSHDPLLTPLILSTPPVNAAAVALPVLDGAENRSVVPPTTTAVALASSDTLTPETVIGDAPGTRVWPPTMNSDCADPVIVDDPNVTTGAVPESVSVESPTTMVDPETGSETGVLLIVIAGPPGVRVWEPNTNADAEAGDAVTSCDPILNTGAAWLSDVEEDSREEVCPFTTIAEADGASEYTVPCTVMGVEPVAKIWPEMIYAEALFAVMVEEPIIRTGGKATAGEREEVLPLTTMAEADGASE